jgi:uncharacterized protein (TIGR03382 family)
MRRLSPLLVLLVAPALIVGCGAKDTDGDRLSDPFEEAIGTNPSIDDSDGDGFTDAEEYLAYYNPMDRDDYPFEGGYARYPAPQNLPEGTSTKPREIDSDGWREGDVSRDWEGEDQHGDLLDLHDFYGQVILVAMGTEEQGSYAADRQAQYEQSADRGLAIIDLLLADNNGIPPDIDGWVDDHGIEYAVVEDVDQEISEHYFVVEGGSFSIPNYTILDRSLTVLAHYRAGAPDFGQIDELLDEDPPQVEWPLPPNVEELRADLGIQLIQQEDFGLAGNMELGAAYGGAAGSGASVDNNAEDGRFVPPSNSDGGYAGPPFGGATCSAVGAPATGPLALLLLGLGFLSIRRRS